jgi:hypothetical protein
MEKEKVRKEVKLLVYFPTSCKVKREQMIKVSLESKHSWTEVLP